jgi:hypothetical protein
MSIAMFRKNAGAGMSGRGERIWDVAMDDLKPAAIAAGFIVGFNSKKSYLTNTTAV